MAITLRQLQPVVVEEIKRRVLEAQSEAMKKLARQHFRYFVEWMNPSYTFAWHNRLIIKKLDQFAKGKIQRLMIFMPPRHGKSELGSRLLPAFMFGLNSNLNVIATSYAADLAQRLNRDVQRIMDQPRYNEVFEDVTLNRSNVKTTSKGAYIRTSDMFEIVGHKGSYRSAGVGGGITGMGADVAIIDDPIKDMAEASSATVKQAVMEWYQSTLYTRLSENGQVLIIQTRWAEDDLSGRLLKQMEEDDEYGDKWEVLSLPAISKGEVIADDPRKIEGLPLWPQKYDLKRLLKIKAAVGSKVWAALYQQEPAPSEGNTIQTKWFRKYQELPEMDYTFSSWDFTFKGKETSDYVVGQVWGVKGVKKYLIYQVREKAGFTDALKMMIDVHRQFPDLRETIVEEKANGAAIIDALKDKIPGIVPYSPKESKEARAAAIAPTIEAGNVLLPDPDYHPDKAKWVWDYLEEFKYFPYGRHDDQVDATTQALIRANNSYSGWLAALDAHEPENKGMSDEIARIFGFLQDQGSGGFGLGF